MKAMDMTRIIREHQNELPSDGTMFMNHYGVITVCVKVNKEMEKIGSCKSLGLPFDDGWVKECDIRPAVDFEQVLWYRDQFAARLEKYVTEKLEISRSAPKEAKAELEWIQGRRAILEKDMKDWKPSK